MVLNPRSYLRRNDLSSSFYHCCAWNCNTQTIEESLDSTCLRLGESLDSTCLRLGKGHWNNNPL